MLEHRGGTALRGSRDDRRGPDLLVREGEARGDRIATSAPPAGSAPPGHGGPTISVIVPVHAGGAAFRRCLEGIRSSSSAADEVFIVMDGETGEATEVAGRCGLHVLRTPDRGGPAAARNLGASAARGEVLLFVDSDVVLCPSTVGEVARAFREDPGLDAVIGSYDDAPAETNFLSQYKNLLHHYVHQNARRDGHTFWGACGAIRRRAFFAVGGFDERYRVPSVEDIELGHRLKAAGCRIAVRKALQVKHLKRWGPMSLLRTDVFRRALPWTELILTAGRMEDDLNTARSERLKVASAFGLWALLGLSCRWPLALILAAPVALILLILDARLLRFFREKRGFVFALRTIPWTWFYYTYCALALAIGVALHVARGTWGGRPWSVVRGSRLLLTDGAEEIAP